MENFQQYEMTPQIPYDIVELPSNGIYYPNKKKTLKVSYLTAADENILTSPNLIKNEELLSTLLRSKILDKDIDVNDLAECDRQAIFIFLRNTAFGTEYKFTLKDPETKEEFEHIEDLSIVQTKEITHKPNENGEFSLLLEKSGKNVKIRLLTPREEDELDKLPNFYKNQKIVPTVTKKLEKCVMEIDGDRDPMSISTMINILPIKDSQQIRKFLDDVKPGLDLVRTTKSPSGKDVEFMINFGISFFRPFFGV